MNTAKGPSAPAAEDPLVNRVFSERYRILKKLGEGGMGIVYLAEHVVIEKKMALKVLFPDLTRRSDLVQRFLQEAKSASRIGHENVIDITDFGQSAEGHVFIAMEYLDGQDLGQILKAAGPIPWTRAQPIVLQVVKALRAAHERGIVHRDVKPENIFILPRDDGREFVKVLDFGIAKVLGIDEDVPRLTRTGMIFGTPEYMAPEQAQGGTIDHRVDIYAVGCILYQMLTGNVPFKAESFMGVLSKHMVEIPVQPSRLNPTISPAVEAIIDRAMQKDPASRFQTMRDFIDAIVPLGPRPDGNEGLPSSDGVWSDRGPAAHDAAASAAAGGMPSTWDSRSSSLPLGKPNLEAARSMTELYPADDVERAVPPPRTGSKKPILIAIGAAALLLAGIGFLLVGSPNGGSATVAPAPALPSAPSPREPPGPEEPAVEAPPSAQAPPTPRPMVPTAETTTVNAVPSEDGRRPGSSSKKAKKRKDRSPRGTASATTRPLSPGAGRPKNDGDEHPNDNTPLDLKNPFAPSP